MAIVPLSECSIPIFTVSAAWSDVGCGFDGSPPQPINNSANTQIGVKYFIIIYFVLRVNF